MWPFRKKPEPPPAPRDRRVWNDDWKVGDTAECVITEWPDHVDPWKRMAHGAHFTVKSFSEGVGISQRAKYYFLHFEEIREGWSTQCFRKVRTVSAEQSEVVQQILTAKPGADNPRKRVKA